MKMSSKSHALIAPIVGILLSMVHLENAWGLVEVDPTLPYSLKSVPVPEPSNLYQFVKDKQAAIALGKALFWDVQVGSDGQACASCHYHAGADNRVKNQVHPGAPEEDGVIDFGVSAQTPVKGQLLKTGANYTLNGKDFPFHRLSDSFDRNSFVVYDNNDVVGSQGVFQRSLTGIDKTGRTTCKSEMGEFNVGGISVRQVTGRNAPSVINAVFNYRNFWDGRANNRFNGIDPFGDRRPFDPNSVDNILIYDSKYPGGLKPVQVQMDNASLASQAVGPALSSGEMTCAGMQFSMLGKKLLPLTPLKKQIIDKYDSVLGNYADKSRGLKADITYAKMIKNAFQDEYWKAPNKMNNYSQMEHNFSLFWGLAVQLYEATLVSNDSPFDKFRENPYKNKLTDQQINGMNLFAGKGMCLRCHRGSEFTAASKSHATESYVERMLRNDGKIALYDTGFYNIGVRPTREDLGLGGNDAFGNPLSFTRLALSKADGMSDPINLTLDPIEVSSWDFLISTGTPMAPEETNAIDGAFKTPTLRNIELTGPYFHNGSYGTLRDTVVFYNRGGDRRDLPFGDDSGYGENTSNLATDIAGSPDPLFPGIVFPTLGLQSSEIDDIVEFLKTLTDERVRWEKAPFDHPSLPLLNGNNGDSFNVTPNPKAPTEAIDTVTVLPAVGAAGRAVKKLTPLMAF